MKRSAAVLLALWTATVSASETAPAARELLRAARDRGRAGDHAGSFRLYLRGAESYPSDPRFERGVRRAARRLAGTASDAAGRKRRAAVRQASRIERSEAAREKELAVRCREGRRWLARGDAYRAFDVFQTVLDETPDFPPARAGMARTSKSLERALKKGKFPSEIHALAARGFALFAAERWGEAAEPLERALAAVPSEDLAAARLAHYAASARAREERQARRRERDALFAGASSAYREGRVEDARSALEAILSRAPSDREARELLDALQAVSAGARAEARKQADEVEIGSRMSAGAAHYVDGRYTDALAEFARVLELRPGHPEALGLLEEVRAAMRDRGHFAPAVTVETEAEKLYREGLRLYGNEKYPEARASFEAALSADPAHQPAREALGRLR